MEVSPCYECGTKFKSSTHDTYLNADGTYGSICLSCLQANAKNIKKIRAIKALVDVLANKS